MKRFINLLVMAIVFALPTMAKDDLKTNFRTALVMAYSPANSVYEDDNLKLEIYGEQLWATNKTDKTIFIDLSQSFLTHNGSSYPMFSKSQDEKKASKANASSSIDEFISIAPAIGGKQNATRICYLSGIGGYGKYTTTESPSGDFSEYDERLLTLINDMVNESLDADPKGKNYLGTSYRHLTECETVSAIGANLAYAFNKRSDDWTPVGISTWVSDLYFAPFYVEMPAELSKNEKRGFGVKKTEAAKIHIKADTPFEFNEEKSPVIVFDWTGDFKKGTFTLEPAKVKKSKLGSFAKALYAPWKVLDSSGFMDALYKSVDEVYYKSAVWFDGQNANWGKMTYFNNSDLSKFNNNR